MKKEITTLFIDLDGTVYDRKNGMMEEMTERIANYMQQVLHVAPERIQGLIDRYYETYGSSLRGIQNEFNIDLEDYLEFVHDIDLDRYLQPDATLRDHLVAIPISKWIFTNASRTHAERVLRKLGIADLFEGILDVWSMEFIPKPHPWVYHHALEMAGDPEPSQCVLIDDSARNLKPAQQIGFSTIWVGDGEVPVSAHLSIQRLHELPTALDLITNDLILPEIFFPISNLQPVL
ncbi:MAG: pyrimidine 5'-nucleotidase [Anaerolineaceae bacterium]